MASLDTHHLDRTGGALARAEADCAARSVRLTGPRRRGLGLLLDAERPLGAYGIMACLRTATGRAVAPPTACRALDFLVRQGLAHRIERLDAYVVCTALAESGGAHAHQFPICSGCGRGSELRDPSVAQALARAAARSGFSIGRAVVEMEGLCGRCAAGRSAGLDLSAA